MNEIVRTATLSNSADQIGPHKIDRDKQDWSAQSVLLPRGSRWRDHDVPADHFLRDRGQIGR